MSKGEKNYKDYESHFDTEDNVSSFINSILYSPLPTKNPGFSVILNSVDINISSFQSSITNLIQWNCFVVMQSVVSPFSSGYGSVLIGFLLLSGFGNVTDGRFVMARTLVPQCLDPCDILTIYLFFFEKHGTIWMLIGLFFQLLNCNRC